MWVTPHIVKSPMVLARVIGEPAPVVGMISGRQQNWYGATVSHDTIIFNFGQRSTSFVDYRS